MLNQEHSTQGALHGNQVTRWLALMMLQPTCPAAAEVTQPIKNNYSAFHFPSCLSGLPANFRITEHHCLTPRYPTWGRVGI